MTKEITIEDCIVSIPEESELTPRDYGIIKENNRNSVKFVWLEEYKSDFKNIVFERHCHLLECSARGTLSFDGKKIKPIQEVMPIFSYSIFKKL